MARMRSRGWVKFMAEIAARQPVYDQAIIPDVDIYCGSATPELAWRVAEQLSRPMGKCDVDHFADGETHVRIQQSARGRDIYIVQSTCPPANEHLIELLVM